MCWCSVTLEVRLARKRKYGWVELVMVGKEKWGKGKIFWRYQRRQMEEGGEVEVGVL